MPKKDWAITGSGNGPSRFLRTLLLDVHVLEDHNWKLYRKYQRIASKEVLFEEYETKDAEVVVVAYGTAARIAQGAVKRLREKQMKIGLFRPITLCPFPEDALRAAAARARAVLVPEMNAGQLVLEVERVLRDRRVAGLPRYDGEPISPSAIAARIEQLAREAA